ncbi:MAG: CehA/McbA family metallohydrolase [Dehalococcoidia bacterium]
MRVEPAGGDLWIAEGAGRAGALIDLHAHTRHKSMDSGLAPDMLAERITALGLSAICITEHNNIWTRAEAAALAERWELPVLRGMEISTDAGHVLVFGVAGYTLEMWNVERLRRIAESEGGVMVLAHPNRNAGFGRPWSDAPDLFEAFEGANGDDHNRSSAYVLDLARSLGLPSTGGSDAHSAPAVGRCATLFDQGITTEAQLIDALRTGACRPVDMIAVDGPRTVHGWLAE